MGLRPVPLVISGRIGNNVGITTPRVLEKKLIMLATTAVAKGIVCVLTFNISH
ncbi:hypothetical protein D3C79_1113800 [compost metagenome]